MQDLDSQPKDSNSGLIDTDSSLNEKPLSTAVTQLPEKHHTKKRIGQYYYYLSKILGSGYSSIVYEGRKNGDKETKYAIKAIKLEAISKANYKLLQNEIKIIQELDHPNIIKCFDVLYTKHHYYIITEYCDSGTLQKHIQDCPSIDWRSILYQVSMGCQYLNSLGIVHRDIKPANVFCKEGVWKIGDFGFARYFDLNINGGKLKENYTIGSPLYMSPEGLIKNVYSPKTDAFALGVMAYYVTTKQFPWLGINKEILIENYKTRQFPNNHSKFKQLPESVQSLIRSLCEKDINQRADLSTCNFQVFLKNEKSISEINKCIMELSSKFTQQATFGQYIYYLYFNMNSFLPENDQLFSMVASQLYSMTLLLDWDSKKSFKQMKQKYDLPIQITSKLTHFEKEDFEALEKRLFLTSQHLLDTGALLNIVGAQKLLQYRSFLKMMLRADSNSLIEALKKLQVHTNYKGLLPNDDQIDYYLSIK